MYIIVVGGGKVGYHLTRALLTDGHEILVIERDKRKCDVIADELGGVVMHGDGCEASTLSEAGTARADMVIAVTGDDEDNMVVCQVAKAKFKVPRSIARINNPKNEGIFKHLGIDETVSSTHVIMERIQMGMPSHPLLHLMDMKAHGLEMVEFRIPAGAKAVGRRMCELSLPPQSVIPLIISPTRGPIVPTGETVIEPEAEMIALTRVETEDQVRLLFTEAR